MDQYGRRRGTYEELPQLKEIPRSSSPNSGWKALTFFAFLLVLCLIGSYIATVVLLFDRTDSLDRALNVKLEAVNKVPGDPVYRSVELKSNTSELTILPIPSNHTILINYDNSTIVLRLNDLTNEINLIYSLLNISSINGTNYMTLVSNNFTLLQIQVDGLNSSIIDIQNDLSTLNSTILSIQTQLNGKLNTINNVTGDPINHNIEFLAGMNVNLSYPSPHSIQIDVPDSVMHILTENNVTVMPDGTGHVLMRGIPGVLLEVNGGMPYEVIIDGMEIENQINNVNVILANHTMQLGEIHTDISDTNTRIDILNQTLLETVQIVINGTNVSLTQIMMDIVTLQMQVATLQSQVANLTSVATPTGSILPWSGAIASIPSGYHLCDGSMLSDSNPLYTPLYGVIGCTFCTNMTCMPGFFCLPNLKGKVPVGEDTGAMHFGMRGTSEGETEHTLNTAEMPGHAHGVGTYSATASSSSRHYHDILLGPNDARASAGGTDPGANIHVKKGTRSRGSQDGVGFASIELTGQVFDSNTGDFQTFDGNHVMFHSRAQNDVTPSTSCLASPRFGALDGSQYDMSSTYLNHPNRCPTDSAHSHVMSGVSGTVGSTGAHNNIQPSLVVNYMIKL